MRDISDGGLAVALAQAALAHGVGATVAQEPALAAAPLFGIFAEPASTMVMTTASKHVSDVEKLAAEYGFCAAQIGTTGGDRLEISIYGQPVIAAGIAELTETWSGALESALLEEVMA